MSTAPVRVHPTWVVALLLCATLPVAACPTAMPGGLRGESVGEELVTNGMPMTIRQVRGKEASADVLDRVEQEWKAGRYHVERQHVGAWDVVSARSADCNTTLQLMDRGGSFGYLGIGKPARSGDWLPRRLSIQLPGSINLNTVVSGRDGGRDGTTIAFSTRRTSHDINAYFLRHLNQAGWEAVSSHEIRAGQSNRARVVTGQKGREHVTIVLWDDVVTRALVTLAEAP